MARLMSVTLTEDAVVERRKSVTRRLGWMMVKVGDELVLCRKVMGRRRPDGSVDPLVRLARVRVVDVRRERLDAITDEDVEREGFTADDWTKPPWGGEGVYRSDELNTPALWFVQFFTRHMRCASDTIVTRIEWVYLEDAEVAA